MWHAVLGSVVYWDILILYCLTVSSSSVGSELLDCLKAYIQTGVDCWDN